MKLPVILLPIGLITACNQQLGKDPGSSANVNLEIAEDAPLIVLNCQGRRYDFNKMATPASLLLRVNPRMNQDHSINWYSDTEKRFIPVCEQNVGACFLSVDADLITETRILKGSEGQVNYIQTTQINRRTGEMRQSSSDTRLGDSVQIEATCEKGQLPLEQAQKF